MSRKSIHIHHARSINCNLIKYERRKTVGKELQEKTKMPNENFDVPSGYDQHMSWLLMTSRSHFKHLENFFVEALSTHLCSVRGEGPLICVKRIY